MEDPDKWKSKARVTNPKIFGTKAKEKKDEYHMYLYLYEAYYKIDGFIKLTDCYFYELYELSIYLKTN